MVSPRNDQSADEFDVDHVFDITNGSFPEQIPERIESSDTIEFRNQQKDEYDIIQVYRDGNEYYRVFNGIELLNISRTTPVNERSLVLSLNLHRPTTELYFCIISSSQRQPYLKSRQYPKEACEKNRLILHKTPIKLLLTDHPASQKVVLHKGDTIELDWTSNHGNEYHIEENQYCPISGGLYKVQPSSTGKFTKTFDEFGTWFLFRLTSTNQIHDIIACIVKEKYHVEHVEITDREIRPNVISIEQHDSVVFEWNTKEKQTIVQIDPCFLDKDQQSIELRREGEDFFWPNAPSTCGYMAHRFTRTGVFCFKTAMNHIGTIIVEPKRRIHSMPVFGDRLILNMNTNDLIEFEWKTTDSPEEPVLLTVDANSSVVPDAAGGLTGIFNCAMHRCVKVESFFRYYFHTCETFLLHIPQHGLYSFAYGNSRDDVLLNVIVERNTQNHHVTYTKEYTFEPNTLVVNQSDQVSFHWASTNFATIHQTDEDGRPLEINRPVFQPQSNSVNYFREQFRYVGMYYFSTDIDSGKRRKSPPLAVIVLPEIRFHYKFIQMNDFDSQVLITNVNDFVIWQFEQIIRFGMAQLRSNETLEDLASCHDRAIPGRNRQCLAVECIMPGAFYFANPEFERVTGSEQDRLISTVVIDPPFSQTCFLIMNRQFVPDVLYIPQNETVAWVWLDRQQYHRISVQSNDEKADRDTNDRLDRSIEQHVPDVHYLHTFHQCGQFTIRSDRFNSTATVVVYSENVVRNEKKHVQQPELIEEIDTLTPFKTRVHLKSLSRNGNILYTLDGTLPTRHYHNAQIYNINAGICFDQSGFHLLRAFAVEDGQVSSAVLTSSATYVLEKKGGEPMDELVSAWNTTKVTLSASIQYPNKLYGKIQVEPASSTDLIDHFELYVDDVAQSVNLSPTDLRFAAEGFAGGEQYEIYILAYPKADLDDASPIPSNKRAFEIIREIDGAPLISLGVSNEHDTIFLMWAHIGNHVSEYVVYVNDMEMTTILEKDFNDFFGIQFHGTQQGQQYRLHVEARIKDSNDIRKSTVIEVNPPLEMSLKEALVDRYFAYIRVTAEAPPPDMRLEIIHLDQFPQRRPVPNRKVDSLPIVDDPKGVVPKISFQPTANGVTLLWNQPAQQVRDIVKSYCIIVDGEQYGERISADETTDFQLNLPPGKHQCYLSVVLKDEDQNTYKSNTLEIEIPSTAGNVSEDPSRRRHWRTAQGKGTSDSEDGGTDSDKYTSSRKRGKKVRVERMHSNGIDLAWDTPSEDGGVKITGYQIYRNGRPIGKPIPADQQRASIRDLELGSRYTFQVVPITTESENTLPPIENDYDSEHQTDYLAGSKLDVQFVDLIAIPSRIWIEKVSGRSALVCWSPIHSRSKAETLPDSYRLHVWNPKEQTREDAIVIAISKDKTRQPLKDLQAATTYEIQLEAVQQRHPRKSDENYIVSTTSDSLLLTTGAPPKAPSNLPVLSCTNSAVRLGFDAFVEEKAEIIALRVQCKPTSPGKHTKSIILDLTPDTTTFSLSNLHERTEYHLTIYAITDEYLSEMSYSDISQLPEQLKPSSWLISQSLTFTTNGCEPASQMCIRSATIESIELEWSSPKAYGSTELIGQVLKWKREHDAEECSIELDCNATKAVIPGVLRMGRYRICIESIFRTKANLDDETDEKEIRLSVRETTLVSYGISGLFERPEVCLTGYTTTTINLTWNKPNMFNSIDHPERLNKRIHLHRKLLDYRVEINGQKYNTLDDDQHQCTLTECRAGEEYRVRLVARTVLQNEYLDESCTDDAEPAETPSKKLRVRMLTDRDLLRALDANFEFHHQITKENTLNSRNELPSLGKINVHWTVSETEKISHFILRWHSSKDLHTQQRSLTTADSSFTIDVRDEKEFYVIELIIVSKDGVQHHYQPLKMPIPGEPDAPKLWLVKTSKSNFVVEWSEPKSYGIPVIGFQLYVEGKKTGTMAAVHLRRAKFPSNVSRVYDVNVCAITKHPPRTRSVMSQTLSVISAPKVHFSDDHEERDCAIPLEIEVINEEEVYVEWKSFLPMREIRSYYVHYRCLNNDEVQTVKVSKQHLCTTLRDLKSGFMYEVMVLAADIDGQILYTSQAKTIQMSVPPNAPIVAIRERTSDHVTLEWRPSPRSNGVTVVGYKLFVNNRLLAILSHDQLTYTLTNGSACDEYTVHLQALSHDKNSSSPLSRAVKFTWPGIKPGFFRRLDNGKTGTVVVAWEHPHLEDETDKLIGFRLLSENVSTHAIRVHGEYDHETYQAAIHDLINGTFLLWLEIQSERHCVRTRPMTITVGRFRNRRSFVPAKCVMKRQQRRRSLATNSTASSFRQHQYS